MIKLTKIFEALQKPEKIYSNPEEEEMRTIADLPAEKKQELFDKGFVLVGNKVINLPKIDQKRKEIVKSKREFDIFTFYPDDDIRKMARDINKLHNNLYRAMTALDEIIKLKKSGKL